MKSLVKMTTVAAVAGMMLSLAGLDAVAGRHGGHRDHGDHGGQRTVEKFRVELRDPDGDLVFQRVVDTVSEANVLQSVWSQYHWKYYKYIGIGEQMRKYPDAFSSGTAARNFTPPGLLAEQEVRRGRVSVRSIQVPSQNRGR